MKITGTIILLMCILPFPAQADTAWTKKDTALLGVYNLLYVADWGQTRYIATHAKYVEANPILGKNPTIQNVDIYFASFLLVQNTMVYILPPKYRKYWMVFFIGFQTGIVKNNHNIGIKIQF